MATIDGRPAQYGISLRQLRELMENRGKDGVAKLHESGGVLEICNKLYTSPNDGNANLYMFNYQHKCNDISIYFCF